MRCYKCKEDLPETEFSRNKAKKRGYQSQCKKCRAEIQREDCQKNRKRINATKKRYYRTHKKQFAGYSRKRWLKKYYNMTLEQYDILVKTQNGCCAICGIPDKKLDVDHDHKTGKVRALLCKRCNTWLAPIENKRFHEAAEIYLEQHK